MTDESTPDNVRHLPLDQFKPVETEQVWIWFTQPASGPEVLLHVLVNDPAQPGITVYRPLLSVDQGVAESFAGIARDAATELGHAAVLREFVAVGTLARFEPGEAEPAPPPAMPPTRRCGRCRRELAPLSKVCPECGPTNVEVDS